MDRSTALNNIKLIVHRFYKILKFILINYQIIADQFLIKQLTIAHYSLIIAQLHKILLLILQLKIFQISLII